MNIEPCSVNGNSLRGMLKKEKRSLFIFLFFQYLKMLNSIANFFVKSEVINQDKNSLILLMGLFVELIIIGNRSSFNKIKA